jgi:hypothetical protein
VDVPLALLNLYAPFLISYKVHLDHETKHLKQIFRLSQRIKGDLNWLKETEDTYAIVAEDGPDTKKYFCFLPVVNVFMIYPQLFSWEYLNLMKTQLDDSGSFRLPLTETFLLILSDKRVTFAPKNLLHLFGSFLKVVRNTAPVVEHIVNEILCELQPLELGQLLKLVDIAAELKDSKIVIDYAKRELYFNSAEQLLAYVSICTKE